MWSTEKDEPSIAFYPPGVLGGLRGIPVDPEGWTHVTVVYEPEVSARLYLDGELAAEAVPEAGSDGASGNVGRLGRRSAGIEGFALDGRGRRGDAAGTCVGARGRAGAVVGVRNVWLVTSGAGPATGARDDVHVGSARRDAEYASNARSESTSK